MMFVFLLACQQLELSEESPTQDFEVEISTYQNEVRPSQWPMDFPADQDLALIFEGGDPIVEAGTSTGKGDVFLPYHWINAVSEAYMSTDVADALEYENIYKDWRLVSMRIVPCSPLGIATTQSPEEFCWPMVRLVWQPVLLDYEQSWGGRVAQYADDRAIHALYPLQGRDEEGTAYPAVLKDEIAAFLQQGGSVLDIPESRIARFREERDRTAQWLLNGALWLRDRDAEQGSWTSFEGRYEWNIDAQGFQERLRTFLAQTAQPKDLRELTSFSLPEGREPAHLDTWVFLAFEGREGNIYQKDIEVIDRESGGQLVNLGSAQTVGMTTEDVIIEDAIAEGNTRLADQIILHGDEEGAEKIADPQQFLVPNTSCASCHKLNDIRFDLHNLSALEDRATTVSPRVEADVLFDQLWTRDLQNRLAQ